VPLMKGLMCASAPTYVNRCGTAVAAQGRSATPGVMIYGVFLAMSFDETVTTAIMQASQGT
jgi:hypothetical protein